MPSCYGGRKTWGMTNAQFKDLDGFVSCSEKHSDLPLLAGCFADGRADPDVPSRAAGLSLLLGEVAQIPGLLQLEEETKSDPLRVVRVRERWTERKRQGKEWKTVEKEQTWMRLLVLGHGAGHFRGSMGGVLPRPPCLL